MLARLADSPRAPAEAETSRRVEAEAPVGTTPIARAGAGLSLDAKAEISVGQVAASRPNLIWRRRAEGNAADDGAGSGLTDFTARLTDAPTLDFGGGESRQLSIELFFDITEPDKGQTDVRQDTDRIVRLTQINRNLEPKRPPTVKVTCGAATTADFPFVGVISNLTQRFTLFKSTGEALRATLNVTFTEFLDPLMNLRQTDPELTTRVVKRGDTLFNIAAEVYRDAALWRLIAEANRLDDPGRLEIGRRLTIPKLQ
jgi:nucleoid-associated protein YgaU